MIVILNRKDGKESFEVNLENFSDASLSLPIEHIELLESERIQSAANVLYMDGKMSHSYLQSVFELKNIEDIAVKEAIECLLEEVTLFFQNLHPDKNISAFNPLIRDGSITNYLPRVHKDYGNNALPNWRRYKAWICLNPSVPKYSLCLCAHSKEYEQEQPENASASGNQKMPPLIGDLNVHCDGRWGWFQDKSQCFILFDGERVYHSAFQPTNTETEERRISIEIRVTCTPKKPQ